jgi:hypothetical protein
VTHEVPTSVECTKALEGQRTASAEKQSVQLVKSVVESILTTVAWRGGSRAPFLFIGALAVDGSKEAIKVLQTVVIAPGIDRQEEYAFIHMSTRRFVIEIVFYTFIRSNVAPWLVSRSPLHSLHR